MGRTLAHQYAQRHDVLTPGRSVLDLTHADDIAENLRGLDFDLLINCAGMTHPDVCEKAPLDAMRVNAEAPAMMAAVCQKRGVRMIHVSTDYVFAGETDQPLSETTVTRPINAYGRSKVSGEQAVMAANSQALVARVSWLFGAASGQSFPDLMLHKASAGEEIAAISDKWSVPSSITDIATWLEHLFTHHSGVKGVLHVCNSGRATWQTFAQTTLDIAHELGQLALPAQVQPTLLDEFTGFTARRPRYTCMDNARLASLLGTAPRSWQDALREWLMQRHVSEHLSAAS